jgi:hypothetical protein
VFLLALTMGMCTGPLDDERPAPVPPTRSTAAAEVSAGSNGVTDAESINFR